MSQGRPAAFIDVGRDPSAVARRCWDLLAQQRGTQDEVFQQEGRMVSIRATDDGDFVVEGWVEGRLTNRLQEVARFRRAGRPCGLPRNVAIHMLNDPNKPLRIFRGIVYTPFLTREGAIVQEAGYHEGSRLYHAVSGAPVQVPPSPSRDEVKRALDLLAEFLYDFPFADGASHANALAVALTPVLGNYLEDPLPLVVVEAPKEGTGKTLLAQTLGSIGHGATPPMSSLSRGRDENRKAITSFLLEGRTIVVFDNVDFRIASGELARVITASSWSDRQLGTLKSIRVPNRCLFIVTGNNIAMNGELSRRSVHIRLDARTEQPWERQEFKHPELLRWVRDHQADLVRALLVLVQYWLASGAPPWSGQPPGSIAKWASTVGGILEAAGVGHFFENRALASQAVDEDGDDMRAFIEVRAETFHGRPARVRELAKLALDKGLLPNVAPGNRTFRGFIGALGRELHKRRDQRFGEFFIRFDGRDKGDKAKSYRLERAEAWQPIKAASGSASDVFPSGPDSLLPLTEGTEVTEAKKEVLEEDMSCDVSLS